MGYHYVPQRYLRNFESPKRVGFIYQYDKRATGRLAREASIDKVVQKRQFYDPEIETILAAKVEFPGSSVIKKLLIGSTINQTERDNLVLYVSTMLMRVPTRRKKALLLIPQVAESTRVKFSTQIHDAQQSGKITVERRDQFIAVVDDVTNKALTEPPAGILAHIRSPWPSKGVLEAIIRMTLRVVRTEGPTFFATSDNPVFFFPSLGLGNELSEISVPLSTSQALHGCHRGPSSADLSQFLARSQFVNEVNRELCPLRKDLFLTMTIRHGSPS